MPIQIVLPAPLSRPKPAAGPTPARHWKRLPERPVLGLVDNGKGRAADVLEAVARHLTDRGLVASHFMIRKTSAGKPITSQERADLLARADVVISGVGDCGACSSCSLHDAVLCSDEATPSAVIVTTPFVRLAQATASNLGAPTLPVMVVEHPIWTRDEAWIDAAARCICDPLMAELFTTEENAA
jgi:hypothetical protein